MFYILSGMLLIWVYTYVNTHWIFHIKLGISLYANGPHLKEVNALPNFGLFWYIQKTGLPRPHFYAIEPVNPVPYVDSLKGTDGW